MHRVFSGDVVLNVMYCVFAAIMVFDVVYSVFSEDMKLKVTQLFGYIDLFLNLT